MWMNDIKNALDPQAHHIINDSKTPSGQVHVGSLRGVLIHDAISRHMKNADLKVKFTYGIDDYDPMDGLPHDAPDSLKKHMGEPLCNIPAPEGSSATDFADHYIADFLKIFDELGVNANIYRMRDIYRSGQFNQAISTILENAHTVREIYRSVSGSIRPDNWYPFQVICEKCGKIGTTEVYDYKDGKVSYRCREDQVSWAKGCSHEGQMSPLDGNGKLPWKLEWAAKWFVFGVTVEGAGKDHCTRGGSRDIACQVVKKIFDTNPPFNVPYEFFLVKGAKMSSSKGIGASARSMADFLPPEVLRYLMLKTLPKKAVNFSTDLNPMLKVFNEYDSLVTSRNTGDIDDEQQQLLDVVDIDSEPKDFQPVNFQLLISMLQLPHINIDDEISARLGRALTTDEQRHLHRKLQAARYWLDHYAAEADKFELQESIPDTWVELTWAQQLFLNRALEQLASAQWNDESLQLYLFNVARCTPVPPKLAFASLYKIFLNKASGPKAGALLSFLDRDYVADRLSMIKISDWYACYQEVSLEKNEFMDFIDKEKANITDLTLTPELYLCARSEDDFTDITSFIFGLGVIEVSFTLKQQQHVKLVKFAIEGESDRDTQKRVLLDKLSMIASELKINGAIDAALEEEITLREEINPEKVDNYLKD